jgi:type IV secretory pathway VirB2 component (pilin)
MEYWTADQISPATSALAEPLIWLQDTLLGTVATTIAIIAVATIGLLLLSGHIDWRRGATTILGCFVLFGAPAIAAGLQSAAQYSDKTVPDAITPVQPVPPAPPIQPPAPPAPHEPVL